MKLSSTASVICEFVDRAVSSILPIYRVMVIRIAPPG